MEKDEIIIQAIIDAAKKLIQQYGLNKTTMEDIAKAAGKGKSTLYYYFKSKDEIFDAVMIQEMDDFYDQVKTAVDKEDEVLSKLRTYIVVKIETLISKINLYRFVVDFQPQTITINDALLKLRERYDKEEIQIVYSILELGANSKTFSVPDNDTMNLLSELLVTFIRGIEMDIVTRNKYSSLASQADLLVGILAKGLK